ncbi:MAG: hypothetical protein K0U93_09370 [Gammaproteobacteria bacterium]|nr:hypothetical protein [Gammaproteobacteria bacterium]
MVNHLLIRAFAIFCMLAVSSGLVSAGTDDDVRAFMEGYLTTFDRGYAKDVSIHYAAPLMMLAPNGDVRTYDTPKKVRRTVKKWKRYLFHNGFERSAWVDLNVRALSDRTAIASTVFERFNTKGEMFQRGAATYTLRKEEDQWKIWLIHVHEPDKAFAFK